MAYFNGLGQGRVGWKSPISGGGLTPSYLLDTYSGAAAAYSLRKLRTAYTGNAIRVRRSSDNTAQDIGFKADGTLDTATMLSFVGSGNGFVSIWYDQSGGGYNATENASASQPQIIDSGSVLMINSKPSMKWSGAQNIRSTPPSVANLTTLALITVVKPTNPNSQCGDYSHVYFPDYGGWGGIFQTATNLGKVGYRFGTGQSSNNNIYSMTVNNLIFGTYKNGSTEIARVNGSDVMTSIGSKLSSIGNTITTLNMGLGEGGTYFNGLQNEVIFYRVNKISDRIGIESNINTYYSIY